VARHSNSDTKNKPKTDMIDQNNYLTPKQIVKELDKYIIGQKDAKKMWQLLCATGGEG